MADSGLVELSKHFGTGARLGWFDATKPIVTGTTIVDPIRVQVKTGAICTDSNLFSRGR
jgi:hypothetical protein